MARWSGWKKIEEQISRAFYDYGKLCSAHPISCLSLSILSSVVLSYPAMNKIELPALSPIDVFWHKSTQNIEDVPSWMHNKPLFHVQQIMLRTTIDNWNASLYTPETVIKTAILKSLKAQGVLNNVDNKIISNLCVKQGSSFTFNPNLVKGDVIVLSPSMLFKDENEVRRSRNLHERLFSLEEEECPVDYFLGASIWRTGIKKSYQTNRQRIITLAITLFFKQNDLIWRSKLIENFQNEFTLKNLDDNVIVNVFYRTRHYISSYLHILALYIFCAVYYYFTAKKFKMVKSKVGLAVASFFNVLLTLTSTLGICQHMDLTASLERAKLFPYLALILSLENTLCVTRSVVYTLPSLNVSTRIAQGLSFEGVNIIVYVVLEMLFLLLGYLTQVSEIQEFCAFAFIGIVVDFYMQLFFYTPCLTFDLLRMDKSDKTRFSADMLSSDLRKLKKFPDPKCPARNWLPQLFHKKNQLVRRLSENNLQGSKQTFKKGHRRAASSVEKIRNISGNNVISENVATEMSTRLRLLYFWTKTRFVQRILMVCFVIWAIWLAFLVHRWQSNDTSSVQKDGMFMSHHLLDTAPIQWKSWQHSTFKWWPVILGKLDMELSGRYITYLPVITLENLVSNDDNDVIVDTVSHENEETSELKNRIDWLEREISRFLLISAILPFIVIVIFIMYMFFWERWKKWKPELKQAFYIKSPNFRNTISCVELAPMAFSRHELPIECASVDKHTVVSASVNGQVFIWDASTGELRNSLVPKPLNFQILKSISQKDRSCSLSEEEVHKKKSRPLVWCLDVSHPFVVMGCSQGQIYLANVITGVIIAGIEDSTVGVSHVSINNNRIVCARLNGVVDVMEFGMMLNKYGGDVMECHRLISSVAHQKPVTFLLNSSAYTITASYDHSIRVFDQTNLQVSHTLHGHKAPVTSICLDSDDNLLFSCCELGRICCWSLQNGQLIKSLEREDGQSMEVTCTTSYLIGFGVDGHLWVWDKYTGTIVFNKSLREQADPMTLLLDIDEDVEPLLREGRFLTALNDRFVVTSDVDSVYLWDLTKQTVIKQIKLPSPINGIQKMDEKRVICVCETELFRISVPSTE